MSMELNINYSAVKYVFDQNKVLLLDAGNSVLKWAVGKIEHGSGKPHLDNVISLEQHGSLEYDHTVPDSGIAQALSLITPVFSSARLASVASDAVTQSITAAVNRLFAVPLHTQSVDPLMHQLQVIYKQPSQLGVDRWLAMIGAQSMHQGAFAVADCGTAFTVDAVNAHGQHLGGIIVPGHRMMLAALLTNTAQIKDAELVLPVSVLGNSTGAAVNAGSSYALAAVLDRFVDDVNRQHGLQLLVFVTGGDRERIVKLAQHDTVEVSDLVLLGLAHCFNTSGECEAN